MLHYIDKKISRGISIVLILLQLFLLPAAKISYAQEVSNPVFAPTTVSRLNIPVGGGSTLLIKNTAPEALVVGDYTASTRVIETNQSNGVNQTYYPYGQTQTKDNTVTDKQFGSHRNLIESGVYHAGARFYNPQMGVFTSADTKEGPNKYAYSGDNPIANTDPSGNFCVPCIVGILALMGMMSTSPMGGSSADTPGEIAQIEKWHNSGGPEFSYALSRMVPGLGQLEGLSEISSGQDALGRDVGKLGQTMNVVDLALGVAPIVDRVGGAANSAIQARRVARYPGGKALLDAQTAKEAVETIAEHAPSNIRIFKSVRINEGFYDSEENILVFGGNLYSAEALPTLRHEGTHVLQKVYGHPGFGDLEWMPNNTLQGLINNAKIIGANMDAELMAYGVGGPKSLFTQLHENVLSTTVRYAPKQVQRLMFNEQRAMNIVRATSYAGTQIAVHARSQAQAE